MSQPICNNAKNNLGPNGIEYVRNITESHSTDICSLNRTVIEQLSKNVNNPKFLAFLARDFIQYYRENTPLLVKPNIVTDDFLDKYLEEKEKTVGITPDQLITIATRFGKASFKDFDKFSSSKPYLSFPKDHGLHSNTQTEWYFIVGTGMVNNIRYSIEYMNYIYTPFPTPFLEKHKLNPDDFRFFAVHFGIAISDGTQSTYFKAPITPILAGGSGLVTYNKPTNTTPFLLKIGDCAFQSLTTKDLFPIRIKAVGINSGNIPFSTDLVLDSTKPIFLHGDEGCDPCIGGLGNMYYSYPAMNVRSGIINYGNNILHIENSGSWWFDHEWMAGFTGPGYPDNIFLLALSNILKSTPFKGWDWFQWTVNNNQYTFSVIRPTEFESVPTTDSHYDSSGYVIDKNGKVTKIEATVVFSGWMVTTIEGEPVETVPGEKVQQGTVVWPTKWTWSISKQPGILNSVTYDLNVVMPYTIKVFSNRQPYKETPVIVTGNDGTVGEGFAESVAYITSANYSIETLRVLGIPITSKNLDAIQERSPDIWLKTKSIIFLLSVIVLIIFIFYLVVKGVKKLLT